MVSHTADWSKGLSTHAVQETLLYAGPPLEHREATKGRPAVRADAKPVEWAAAWQEAATPRQAERFRDLEEAWDVLDAVLRDMHQSITGDAKDPVEMR